MLEGAMFRTSILTAIIVALGFGTVSCRQQSGQRRLEDLTKQEYGAMSDASPIFVDGHQTTKAKIRELSQRRRDQVLARFESSARQMVAKTLEERRQALELEQAPFAARTLVPTKRADARPIAEDRLAAIRKEAEELAVRASTGSQADREVIERRAAELLLEIQGRR